MAVADLRVMGRATQGVRLINLKNNDEIAAVAKVEVEEDEEMNLTEEGMEGEANAGEENSETGDNPTPEED